MVKKQTKWLESNLLFLQCHQQQIIPTTELFPFSKFPALITFVLQNNLLLFEAIQFLTTTLPVSGSGLPLPVYWRFFYVISFQEFIHIFPSLLLVVTDAFYFISSSFNPWVSHCGSQGTLENVWKFTPRTTNSILHTTGIRAHFTTEFA